MSEVEIDRRQCLRIPETITPTCMSGRCVNDVFGGPGWNRTTDTRIFKSSIAPNFTVQNGSINVIPILLRFS